MFSDAATAEKWLEELRWPDGRFCPHCGSTNDREEKDHWPMRSCGKDCRSHFSVKRGTVMQSSRLGCRKWTVAVYMMATGIKGTASMKVYRDIGIRQATACSTMHRIRESFDAGDGLPFPALVEVDESDFGGKEKNKHKGKKLKADRSTVGKTTVAGAKDRAPKKICAALVARTDKKTLHGFVVDYVAEGAKVDTVEAAAHKGMPFDHESVNRLVGEYVDGMAHANNLESFLVLLKGGYSGTFHHISPQQLNRYIRAFAGRRNVRNIGTPTQMSVLAQGMVDKRLMFVDLVVKTGAGP